MMDEDKQLSAEGKMDRAEEKVINAIAETMDLYGITPSVGRLYATMYFHQQPMTLDEMKDELGMTKPSMSTAVRSLQDINIVRKTWQKGSRKDHFVAEKNFFNYFIHFFSHKWRREAELNLVAIEEAEIELQSIINDETVQGSVHDQAAQDLEQLKAYKAYCFWLQRLVEAFETGDIFDFLPMYRSDSE